MFASVPAVCSMRQARSLESRLGVSGVPQDAPPLVRPEWLFEVVNYIQGRVFPQHLFQVEANILEAWPPQSVCERQLLSAMVARLEVSSLAHFADGQAPWNAPRVMKDADVAAEMAAALIRSHPPGPWTPAVLARRTHCNRTQLQAAFRSRWLYSIHAYLNMCRIEAAKTLLRTTPCGWRRLRRKSDIGAKCHSTQIFGRSLA